MTGKIYIAGCCQKCVWFLSSEQYKERVEKESGVSSGVEEKRKRARYGFCLKNDTKLSAVSGDSGLSGVLLSSGYYECFELRDSMEIGSMSGVELLKLQEMLLRTFEVESQLKGDVIKDNISGLWEATKVIKKRGGGAKQLDSILGK